MILLSVADGFEDIFDENGHNLKVIKTTNVDLSDIKAISVDLTYGNLNLSSYDGDKIIIIERSNKDLDEDELLDINQDEDNLSIKQPFHFEFFNIFGSINKRIVIDVKLPDSIYKEIKLKATSGNLKVENINTNVFNVKITSGNINTTNVKTDNLNLNMTSGNANLDGTFPIVKTNMTSGNIKLSTDVAPSNLSVEVTSGNVSISIPDNEGFTLSEKKTSGTFRSDFELDDFNVYRNGKNKYKIRMTSGTVKLLMQ
jgi:hypothetical protein